MRALALVRERKFESIELPEPTLAEDHVQIQVESMAICGSDLTAYVGGHTKIRLPTVLGHEFAGTVNAIGSRVTRFKVGDRVVGDPTSGCGQCAYCQQGRKNICAQYRCMGMNLGVPGAMSRLVAIPETRVHSLGEGVSFASGAIVQPLSISYHAVAHRGRVQAGESVLVVGAGPIGLGIVLAAKAAGGSVTVVDPLAYRRDVALGLGADQAIDPTKEDVIDAVQQRHRGYGVDVAFEAVGGPRDDLLIKTVRATAPGGRIVVLGLKMPEARVPIHEVKSLEKTVLGSQAHPDSFPTVLSRLADATYEAEQLITHQIPMDEAPRAFALLESKAESVLKVVLTA